MNTQKLSGRKLNEAVARKCFGWEWKKAGAVECPGWHRGGYRSSALPDYDSNSAAVVLEWLHKREWVRIHNDIKDGWVVALCRLPRKGNRPEVTGKTFALAVCRAAVWSAMNEEGGVA